MRSRSTRGAPQAVRSCRGAQRARPRGARRHACSPCSGPTARARPRPSTSSRRSCCPMPAPPSVAGLDVVADPDEVQRRISLTGQSAAVDEVLTGDREPRHDGPPLGLGRRCGAARVPHELLERFGLTDAAGRRVAHLLGRHAPPPRPRAQPRRRRRRCSSSTSPPPASTPAAARSLGGHPLARRRGHDRLPDDPVPRGGRPARRSHRRPRRRPRSSRRARRRAQGPHRRRGRRAARRRRPSSSPSCRPTARVHGLRAAIDELDRSGSRRRGVQVTIRRPSLDDVFLAITGGARPPPRARTTARS